MKLIESIRRGIVGPRRLDDRGVAAVEFAGVFVLLIIMTFGIIELGLMMATLTSMEGGLKEASRYGITGQSPTDGARIEKIRAILEDHTIRLVDFKEATFTVKTYPSFSGIGQPEPFTDSLIVTSTGFNCHNGEYDSNLACHETFTDSNSNGVWDRDIGVDGAGEGGEVVSYTVEVPWHIIMLPYVGDWLAPNGTLPLRATIVVRNEPNLYPGSVTPPGGS